jgi:hypothetical protein
MTEPSIQPTLNDLILKVQASANRGTELEQLEAAVAYAGQLGELADSLVGHFVSLARHAGASWTQIGDALGVSKQGAQQRFVPREPADASAFADRALFQRFTDRARQAVLDSEKAARELNHGYIGTEHLLIGVIRQTHGVAAVALAQLGVDADAVAARVREAIPPGESAPGGRPPFTPRAKIALEMTMREALKLGHNYIGTEHMILALANAPEGVAVNVLTELGVSASALHDAVIGILAGYGKPNPPTSS